MYVFMYLFLQNLHQGLCADQWSKTYRRHWISISFFFFLRQYCYILLLEQNNSLTRCNL